MTKHRHGKLTRRSDGAHIVFEVRLADGPRVGIFATHRRALNFLRKNIVNGYVAPVFVFPGEWARDKALRLMRERVHATPGSIYDLSLRRQIWALLAGEGRAQ